jgi:ribonuclease-3
LPPSLAQAGAKEGSTTAYSESCAHAATFYGTTGHLALFNQHLQKANKRVEWVYWDGKDVPPAQSTPLFNSNNSDALSVESDGATSTAIVTAGWYADPGVPEHLRIEGTQVTPVWYVKVLVEGEFYGRGRGNTKKSARNEAAKEGLVKLGIEV